MDNIIKQLKSFRNKLWNYSFIIFIISSSPILFLGNLRVIGPYLGTLYLVLLVIIFIYYSRRYQTKNEAPIFRKGWIDFLILKGEIENQDISELDLKQYIRQYLKKNRNENKASVD